MPTDVSNHSPEPWTVEDYDRCKKWLEVRSSRGVLAKVYNDDIDEDEARANLELFRLACHSYNTIEEFRAFLDRADKRGPSIMDGLVAATRSLMAVVEKLPKNPKHTKLLIAAEAACNRRERLHDESDPTKAKDQE